VFRSLPEQQEYRVEEGPLIPDHVYMLLAIPPKYAVAQIRGRERKEYESLILPQVQRSPCDGLSPSYYRS
jgi:REP element-mobilizing transposase RayT